MSDWQWQGRTGCSPATAPVSSALLPRSTVWAPLPTTVLLPSQAARSCTQVARVSSAVDAVATLRVSSHGSLMEKCVRVCGTTASFHRVAVPKVVWNCVPPPPTPHTRTQIRAAPLAKSTLLRILEEALPDGHEVEDLQYVLDGRGA